MMIIIMYAFWCSKVLDTTFFRYHIVSCEGLVVIASQFACLGYLKGSTQMCFVVLKFHSFIVTADITFNIVWLLAKKDL